MIDCIVRAEEWLRTHPTYSPWTRNIVTELVTELKAARAQRDEWKAQYEHDLNYSALDRSCDDYYGMGQ